ncbi:hypothetical protein J6590_044889 [Homalodisca vitripennis]|nr:hypothetical protein J6590_044889 [Homalodisca vitripennis]
MPFPQLVAHVTSLMSTLNGLCKDNRDLQQELKIVEPTFENNYKRKAMECNEVEDQYDGHRVGRRAHVYMRLPAAMLTPVYWLLRAKRRLLY